MMNVDHDMTKKAIFNASFGIGKNNFSLFPCCKGRKKVTLNLTLRGSNTHMLCFIERTQNNKYNKLKKTTDFFLMESLKEF